MGFTADAELSSRIAVNVTVAPPSAQLVAFSTTSFVRLSFTACAPTCRTRREGVFFGFIDRRVAERLTLAAGLALNPVVRVNEVDGAVTGT